MTPTPTPSVPTIQPTLPPFDLTWFWEGLATIGCGFLVILFVYLLVKSLRGYGSVHPGYHVAGLAAAVAGTIWFGIDSTNQLWEPLRPYTAVGVIALLVVGGMLATKSSAD